MFPSYGHRCNPASGTATRPAHQQQHSTRCHLHRRHGRNPSGPEAARLGRPGARPADRRRHSQRTDPTPPGSPRWKGLGSMEDKNLPANQKNNRRNRFLLAILCSIYNRIINIIKISICNFNILNLSINSNNRRRFSNIDDKNKRRKIIFNDF